MNIVAVIPYWEKYRFPDKSISNRDTLEIGGHTLLERTISICNEVENLDDVIIIILSVNPIIGFEQFCSLF